MMDHTIIIIIIKVVVINVAGAGRINYCVDEIVITIVVHVVVHDEGQGIFLQELAQIKLLAFYGCHGNKVRHVVGGGGSMDRWIDGCDVICVNFLLFGLLLLLLLLFLSFEL